VSYLGSEKEAVSSDENQLAGERPMTRYTVVFGRFTVTDFFDYNRYTHDPRRQFMGWGVMYNGAWDYPAGSAIPGSGEPASPVLSDRAGR
jgi:high affinity Mn2+ porin